jgi:hypothetical protein
MHDAQAASLDASLDCAGGNAQRKKLATGDDSVLSANEPCDGSGARMGVPNLTLIALAFTRAWFGPHIDQNPTLIADAPDAGEVWDAGASAAERAADLAASLPSPFFAGADARPGVAARRERSELLCGG